MIFCEGSGIRKLKENPNLNPDRTNPSYDGKLDQRVAVLEVKIKAFLEKTLETKKHTPFWVWFTIV